VVVGAALLRATPQAKPRPGVYGALYPVVVSLAAATKPEDVTNFFLPTLNPGGRLAGISCVPMPTPKAPDLAVCHVAVAQLGN
jgi:hypothetical protein